MLKRFEVIVKGNVQRVAFRQFIKWLAKRYRLHGKVANLQNYDEDVLIIIEGGGRNIRKFLQRLAIPTAEDLTRTAAKISKVIAEEKPYTGEFKEKPFEIVANGNELQERLDDGLVMLKNLQGLYDETKAFRKETAQNFGSLMSETKAFRKESANNFNGLKSGTNELKNETHALRKDTSNNFSKLDSKYGSVSKTLKGIGGSIKRMGRDMKQNNRSLSKIARNFDAAQ